MRSSKIGRLMDTNHYDLIVIGSGPAGQKAAIAADIVSRETSVILSQFKRNGVAVYEGTAEFIGPHAVQISDSDLDRSLTLHADDFLIACGTLPARELAICFDGEHIIATDQLLSLTAVPKEVIVVGAGIVGLEYAPLLATRNS